MASQALAGLRVVEYGHMVAAAYATKLLADLGADVIKVEPPSGDRSRLRGPFPGDTPDPERSGLFLYLNSNKRGVTLDLASEQGRGLFARLAATADLVVHNLPPREMEACGLSYESLAAPNPRLVMASITPFGLTGPYRDYAASDLVLWNAGGIAYLNGGGPGHDTLPPLKAFGHQAEYQGGLNAALAALGALFARARSGRGQHVSISIQECLVAILELTFEYWPYAGLVASRLGQRPIQPLDFLECRDGWVFVCCVEEHQWRSFVGLMGDPEWAQLELFETRLTRAANWDALKLFLQEWAAQQNVHDVYYAAQKRRIPFAPVSTMGDLLASEHLKARGFFAELRTDGADGAAPSTLGVDPIVVPGAPYKLAATPWLLRTPAPRLGQHNAEVFGELEEEKVRRFRGQREGEAPAEPLRPGSAGASPSREDSSSRALPLEGIRVADFTWVWAGPFCTLQLAHLGAEVIRVESANRTCVTRLLPPWHKGEFGVNRSGYFNQYNLGKLSLTLDLKHPQALAVAKDLIANSDIVCENFAAGVMERMGLGYSVARAINPAVIMISLSGYGATGPESQFVSYGPAQVPLSGMSSLTGYAGWPPMHVGISYGDPTGGLHGAVAVLAALLHRQRTGEGQYIDLSQQETSIAVLAEGILEQSLRGTQPPRSGNRDPQMAPHGVFRCAGEQEWVAISVRDDAEWARLAAIMGDPRLGTDPRFSTLAARKTNEDALEALVGEWTAARTTADVVSALQAADIPAFASMSNAALSADPHLNQAGFFVTPLHPEVGALQHVGMPWRMSGTPTSVRRAAPCLGQHTDDVLTRVLGYTAEQIAALREQKVLV